MGGENPNAISAYDDLQAVWDSLSKLGASGTVPAAEDLGVSVTEDVGNLGERQVTVSQIGGMTEKDYVSAKDFVRERLAKLFGQKGEKEIDDMTEDFLRLQKPLPDRNILFGSAGAPTLAVKPSQFQAQPPTGKVASAQEVVARLKVDRVRMVSTAALKQLSKDLSAFVKAHKNIAGLAEDLVPVKAAIDRAVAANNSFLSLTAAGVANSWKRTQLREGQQFNADQEADPETELVEIAVEANMDAATAIQDFIGRISDRCAAAKQKNPKANLVADAEYAEGGAVAKFDEAASAMTLYAGDITRLAEDLVALKQDKGMMTERARKRFHFDDNVSDWIRRGKAAAFDAQTEATLVEKLGQVEEQFARIESMGDKADAQQQGQELAQSLEEIHRLLRSDKGARTADETAHWRLRDELLGRVEYAAAAVSRWTLWKAGSDEGEFDQVGDRGNRRRKTGEYFEKLPEAERRHLRSASVLESVFNGEFDMEFYLQCRQEGATADEVDFAYDTRGQGESNELGRGAMNTVLDVKYHRCGCHDSRFHGVFKPHQQASVFYHSNGLAQSFYGFSDEYSPLHVNYAAYRIASEQLGLSNTMVRTRSGYCNGQFGLIMDKVPGKPASEFLAGDFVMKRAFFSDPSAVGRLLVAANDVDWCDYLTGQYDRHFNNVMIDLQRDGKKDFQVQVTGIDNDTCFPASRIGRERFKLNIGVDEFAKTMKNRWVKLAHNKRDFPQGPMFSKPTDEMMTRLRNLGVIELTQDNPPRVILDRSKCPLEELGMFSYGMGLNSARRPSFITTRVLAKLEALHTRLEAAKAKGESDEFDVQYRDYLPAPAIQAMRLRFEELYAYAQGLKAKGKVVDEAVFAPLPKTEEGALDTGSAAYAEAKGKVKWLLANCHLAANEEMIRHAAFTPRNLTGEEIGNGRELMGAEQSDMGYRVLVESRFFSMAIGGGDAWWNEWTNPEQLKAAAAGV